MYKGYIQGEQEGVLLLNDMNYFYSVKIHKDRRNFYVV